VMAQISVHYEELPPYELPIDYTVCTGARIVQHALRHLIEGIKNGHGTPTESFLILWEARKAAWKETLEIMDAENHPDCYAMGIN
jgi:hypothetical protein